MYGGLLKVVFDNIRSCVFLHTCLMIYRIMKIFFYHTSNFLILFGGESEKYIDRVHICILLSLA